MGLLDIFKKKKKNKSQEAKEYVPKNIDENEKRAKGTTVIDLEDE
jgi:hypothetical protein